MLTPAPLLPRFWAWLGGGLLLFLGSFQEVRAAQGVGLAPPRFELVLAPGERATKEFVAFTEEGKAVRVRADLLDYTQDGRGNVRFLPPGHQRYSLYPFLQIALDPFTLQKGRNRRIPFTVTAPEKGEGSYWIALALTTEPRPRPRGGELVVRVMQRLRLVAGIYLTVAGTARPEAEVLNPRWRVREGTVDRPIWIFELEVRNLGNTYLRLAPRLFLKDQTGREIYSETKSEVLILRGASVRLAFPFPEVPEAAVLGGVELLDRGPSAVRLSTPLYAEAPLK